ncbi:hypothetical protein [Microbacterium sp. YY-01]|uniref:hypothetical protein n=1 Tax=Microbacterium sp. YY-01 TaxID=3421634 RepID=UPI003D17E0E7
MSDFQISTNATGVAQDTRWRWSAHGEDSARPGQLDISTLDAQHIVNGRAPSGLALGQITASKLYGPYDASASDGREVLAGYLNDNIGPEIVVGGKPTIAVLKHGIIKASLLPIASQRAAVITADTTGSFTYVED